MFNEAIQTLSAGEIGQLITILTGHIQVAEDLAHEWAKYGGDRVVEVVPWRKIVVRDDYSQVLMFYRPWDGEFVKGFTIYNGGHVHKF